MQTQLPYKSLSPLAELGQKIYSETLKSVLEPAHDGEAVAIHVDSGDYAVADNHSAAARALLKRRQEKSDGRIVTLTIGTPTDSDIRLATTIAAGRKR